MACAGFRGVSAEQDSRFANKEKKLIKSMKFPAMFSTKVDLTKVNWDAMKPWIAKRITELLGGLEDDVLIGYVYEQLEGKKMVDPRKLQISLTGFLEKNTSLFCKELWQLLISANQSGTGIPQRFLDEKAEELRQQKEEQERVQTRIREANEQWHIEGREQMELERAERERWQLMPKADEEKHQRTRSRSRSRDKRRRRSRSESRDRRRQRSASRERRGGRDGSRERRQYKHREDRSRDRRRNRSRSKGQWEEPEELRQASRSPEHKRRASGSGEEEDKEAQREELPSAKPAIAAKAAAAEVDCDKPSRSEGSCGRGGSSKKDSDSSRGEEETGSEQAQAVQEARQKALESLGK